MELEIHLMEYFDRAYDNDFDSQKHILKYKQMENYQHRVERHPHHNHKVAYMQILTSNIKRITTRTVCVRESGRQRGGGIRLTKSLQNMEQLITPTAQLIHFMSLWVHLWERGMKGGVKLTKPLQNMEQLNNSYNSWAGPFHVSIVLCYIWIQDRIIN
jgi:hypothetical protein